ncbi:hypothetical protein [Paracidovorax wautersii]|uniref:hypothetical protein n=1 Tax=Paracidovorax wautersii TaxID=1177982 RepID=UPI0031E1B8DB
MKTVYIDVVREVTAARFSKIKEVVAKEALNNPDFCGYDLQVRLGDYTCAEQDEVSEKSAGALVRLVRRIGCIASGECESA